MLKELSQKNLSTEKNNTNIVAPKEKKNNLLSHMKSQENGVNAYQVK